MSEGAVKIAIRGLSKSFGANHVLTELDLDIQDGESLVIIGASGTGKSVLLKNIVGILTPDSGSIKIAGEEVVGVTGNSRDRINRKLGMLFQGAALFDSLTLWENAAFGLMSAHGMDGTKPASKLSSLSRSACPKPMPIDTFRYLGRCQETGRAGARDHHRT